MVTPENFILKLGTRDYVEEVTYYTIFDADRFSRGFFPNSWNITLLWLFLSCPFFLLPTPSSNRAAHIHALWLKWHGSAHGRSFMGLGRWVTLFGEMYPKNPQKTSVSMHFQAKLPKSKNCEISKTVISPKFDDKTYPINGTSWVVHHSRTWNTTWLTSTILKINTTS